MATYRNVNTSFWTDTKISDDFTPEDKFFYLYLMTNTHTSLCGCYEISIKQMADETGYSKETIEKLINRMMFTHSVISYSKESKEVLILNWHKYNWTNSQNVISAINTGISHVKTKVFKEYLEAILDGVDTVSIGYTDTIPTSLSLSDTFIKEDRGVGEEEKENFDDVFEQLWKLYPRKEGKSNVSNSQKKKIAKIGLEKMTRCVERFNKAMQGREKQYIMQGGRFFNKCYVDYLDENYEAEDSTDKAVEDWLNEEE